MTRYAASVVAESIPNNRVIVTSTVFLTDAQNKQEALGNVIEFARQRWPEGDGYFGHQAIVLEIPDSEPTGQPAKSVHRLPTWASILVFSLFTLIIATISAGTTCFFVNDQPVRGIVGIALIVVMAVAQYGVFYV